VRQVRGGAGHRRRARQRHHGRARPSSTWASRGARPSWSRR
jgi:hypothetical protein